MRTKQIIVVSARGNTCRVDCFQRNGDEWERAFLAIKGYVGKNGTTRNKREGDGKTPLGVFTIDYAFGTSKRICTKLDYMPVKNNTRWCCDVENRRYYNTVSNRRWLVSCEDMWKYKKEYEIGLVLGYNTDKRDLGRGSAIFMHCKNSPTAGCVAVQQPAMKRIVRWLNKTYKPCIIIKNFGNSEIVANTDFDYKNSNIIY